jgi:hypothetical protein
MKTRISTFMILLLTVVIIVSCSKTNNLSGVQLIVKTSGVKSAGLKSASLVTVDTFLINIKEIEFGIDEEREGLDDCEDSTVSEFELDGPFLIDILSSEALTGMQLATADLPRAVYDEIEFKLDRYHQNSSSKLYNRTIFIAGTIDGKRMRMWYTGDYDFEVKYADTTNYLNLDGAALKVYLDFHLNNMLASLNSFDFSGAKDLNGNGIIEIGSDDTDGNRSIAHHLIVAVHKCCDLDDKNDDD